MTKNDWSDVPVSDVRKRIIQSNDVAEIVIGVIRAETPDLFPLLNLRYGIADALWDAGYRKEEQ